MYNIVFSLKRHAKNAGVCGKGTGRLCYVAAATGSGWCVQVAYLIVVPRTLGILQEK